MMTVIQSVFDVGDRVVNIEQHRDENNRLVKRNTIGYVDTVNKVDDTYTVIWQIEEYPYVTKTTRASEKLEYKR